MSRLIAITGATGFIGRRLVAQHLMRGDRVRILTRFPISQVNERVEVVIGSLANGRFPRTFPGTADVLYHCAAELNDPASMDAVNREGTQRLAEVASGRIGRWVQLSSVGVYGSRCEGEITEDMPLAPVNGYECSKAAGDLAVLNIAASGGFDCVVLRPSIVFGSGMTNRSIALLAKMIRRRLFFFIGSPGASANYVPVENVVNALLLCASHPVAVGRIYNLSDWTTIEDFVGIIADIVGVVPPRLRLPLAPICTLARIAGLFPGSPLTLGRVAALSSRNRYPTRRLEADLGYRHLVGIAGALRSTLLAEGFGE